MLADINAQTAKDMKEARSNISINVATVRDYLFDGRVKWETYKRIEDTLCQDPMFDKSRREFIGRAEAYERALAITKRLVELQRIHRWTREEMSNAVFILSEALPIGLHNNAFEPVFLGQASPSMISEYWDLVSNKGIQGCYLQTELGHGSNVNCLETTATYIPEVQEFEIHSPTLTSNKWWVGGLGKTATHGVIQAKLILPGGKDMGPHLFLIQLRSLEDHSTLPGISMGDIGPKALGGLASLDHGYARFTHVRIPRTHMFSKFAEVTEGGQYIQPLNPKHSFGGMMYIRAGMVATAGWTIAKAITIAIRYATVRRQGEPDTDGLERQIIQYPSTHYRLLSILSRAYVFIHLGRHVMKEFTTVRADSDRGDFSGLSRIHPVLCGLKVLVSTATVKDLETARRTLGGHGYSAFAGIGRLYADYLPAVTYEGDNFVLDGQVARLAVKAYRLEPWTSARALGTFFGFIHLLKDTVSRPSVDMTMWEDPEAVIHLLEWRAALMLRDFVQTMDELDSSATQRLARAITDAFISVKIRDFVSGLRELPPGECNAVRGLYHLYLLVTAEDAMVDLFSTALLKHEGRTLRLAIKAQCHRLLTNAIGLTDAFSFSDWQLDSALGVFDGRVYEELWRRVQLQPFNSTDITTGYHESLRPLLQAGQLIATKAMSKL